MKLQYILFLLILTFISTSCSLNNDDKINNLNSKVNNLESRIKNIEENNQLINKKITEISSNTIITNKDFTSSNKENNSSVNKKEDTNYIISKEDIKLAGCDEIIEVGEQKWCKNNSQLVKPVEGYKTTFSKSIQNDSGFRGIYENENGDKLYTFEYLEKACGTDEDVGILIDENVKNTCPCPKGYHIPTPKEWKDAYSFYKKNKSLVIDNLNFKNNVQYRPSSGEYFERFKNLYHTSYYTNISLKKNLLASIDDLSIRDSYANGDDYEEGNAYPLRCIKNK